MNDKSGRIDQRNIPNPSEWMRARRPNLFSDSTEKHSFKMSRVQFEYHLDTLTSRKEEYKFEYFCRKIAEKEICPNLRPQTGPTGGGDSKVDAETYPVAPEISERWWMGTPAAGEERWAFAFSAKKEWSPKLSADIKSVLSTGRDYKIIYFFTNQFVSDKKRSSKEDTLSKEIGIPVHIIDRSWIVEKVFESGHLELAVSALAIEEANKETHSLLGPKDTARLAELTQLDAQVSDPTCYQDARYQLVEDCLRSAILARGLERPRNEVESRFLYADKLASDLGYVQQQLRIAYNYAWTMYWWYEDYAAFNKLYEAVEKQAELTSNAADTELLLNLWQLLYPSISAGRLSAQIADVVSRSNRLVAILTPLANDSSRPNNALRARTDLALLEISNALAQGDGERVESGWKSLHDIAEESENLGTYPLERLFELVVAIGEFADSKSFDLLYEKVTDLIRKRRSDGEAGDTYAERGVQKLRHNKPYEAIHWLGRSEELLIKEEYRAELIRALLASSYAYERVGLLWAARNKIIAAIERLFSQVNEDGKIPQMMIFVIQRLVWIELQLGRVPQTLSAMILSSIMARNLTLAPERQNALAEEQMIQEAVLGMHLLNIPLEMLYFANQLPDALERIGLHFASTALLFNLGHESALREQGAFPQSESSADVHAFFERLRDQPAAEDIPDKPTLVVNAVTMLHSRILGVLISIETPNNAVSFGVAESLLGALEAFLSTSSEEHVLPHRERLNIRIIASDKAQGVPTIRFPDTEIHVEIEHPLTMTFSEKSDHQEFRDWLKETIVHVACRMLIVRDVEAWLSQVAGDEKGFSRALAFGDILTLNEIVFGKTQQVRLEDWILDEDTKWPVKRTTPFAASKQAAPTSSGQDKEPIKFGDIKDAPAGRFDTSQLKHTERRVMSPIDMQRWGEANWHATLFVGYGDAPPLLALAFHNGDAGQAIFRAWKEQLGDFDKDDVLRISIVRGVSKKNPAEYSVLVGPNLNHLKESESKTVLFVSRINRMTPESTKNLDWFISSYKRHGAFILAPAEIKDKQGNPFPQLGIVKRTIHIRNAWEIGENDQDMSALQDDDDPIVPVGVDDAPLRKAMLRMKELRRRK